MMQATLPRVQRGLSIVGLIVFGTIALLLVLLGAKLVPAITEYLAIERAVQKIKSEANTVADIRRAFDRYAAIDDIKSISSKELDITKVNERIVISYSYPYQIHLFGNVRLVIDFAGTTSDRPGRNVP
ncbi:MAG: DUF4845 domain-containing protein [Burkholderiales bacterium]|jgi:hypothetical protein|nr:DUF4845 domain-containing protein [Burkholderiales bacterium]